jgi:aryl-alcohol dehydrogenase-like predicted oxidoreductase
MTIVVHAALDAGIRLIDTARSYTTATHPGHSEAVVARALASHPAGPETLVATKGGYYRSGDDFLIDSSPEALRKHCQTSLSLLEVDRIALYFLHVPDPRIPVGRAMITFAELREEGKVQHVGLSNVTIAQVDEAIDVVPVAAVQNRFSVLDTGDREMVDYCAERGIAYFAYSPLGSGPALGNPRAALSTEFPEAAAVAERKGISTHRLALAWLLALSPTLIAVCGPTRPESARDCALAAEVSLTADEIESLDFGGASRGA